MSRICQSDGSFGPGIGSCRGGFDFTLLFEDSILGLLPQALLLLLAPIRLKTLIKRHTRVTRQSTLGVCKLFVGALYAAAAFTLLVLWSLMTTYKSRASIASAIFQFFGAITVLCISRLEHTKAIRPSHLLQLFLLVNLLTDAVRLRTLFLMDYSSAIVATASVQTVLTANLLLLESLDKRRLLPQGSRPAPEETLDLFADRLFLWLNSLFKTGYRKVLTAQDLFGIDEELISETTRQTFRRTWTQTPNKKRKSALLRVVFKVLGTDILFPILPKALEIVTTVAQPFLISSMLNFIQGPHDETTRDKGYGLVAAFGINYTLLAVATSWYAQSVARMTTKLRGCLIDAIFHQTLIIDANDVDSGAGTMLMNVDVEKVIDGSKYTHDFWSAMITCAVAMYLLYTELGSPFVAPLITIIAGSAVGTWIGRSIKPRQLAWVAATQKRVNAIANATSYTKTIRLLGLVETVQSRLSDLREHEINSQIYIRKAIVWVSAISNALFSLASMTTYTTYGIIAISAGKSMDVQLLFVSMAAIKLITTPLIGTLQHVPPFMGALGCLERIQNFLSKDAAPNVRIDFVSRHNTPARDTDEIEMTSFAAGESSIAFRIANGSFGVDNRAALLHDIDLEIPRGSFTMLFGKVASGKSILLRTFVKEMVTLEGSLDVRTGGVAFCGQSAWLRNVTLRENIIAETQFDRDWYTLVTWACGLHTDFAELKNGDETTIGSKGVSLSGGQKNRVALARAIYSRKSVVIIDDVLSGLDNTTEKLVFNRLFSQNGLLRRSQATIVLATHAIRWASQADQVLVMSGGTITERGTYNSLTAQPGYLRSLGLEKSKEDGGEDTGKSNEREIETEEHIPTPLVYTIARDIQAEMTDQDAAEGPDRRSGDIKTLFYFLGAMGRQHLTIYFIFLIGFEASVTSQSLWLKWWAQSDDSKPTMIRNLSVFIAITIINIVLLTAWLAHYMLVCEPRSSFALHTRQLNTLMHATFCFIVGTDVGSITNRFSQDISLVDMQLPMSWLNSSEGFLAVAASLALVIAATPPVAALVPFLALAGWLIQRVYLRTSRQIRLMDLEAKAPLCTHFLETLSGIMTVRAFGWAEVYAQKNRTLLDRSQVPFYLLAAIQNWLKLVLELMVAGLVVVVVGTAVALKSKIDPGFLGLALVGIMELGQMIEVLIIYWTQLETSLSAVSRIRSFSDDSPLEPQPTTSSQISALKTWPSQGMLSIRNLQASYSPSSSASPVLRDITLDIAPGERIGICGRTGSGKSSLVAALFQLLHIQSGSIFCDDVDLSTIPPNATRSKINALPQEPFFLPGSVRQNLSPWSTNDARTSKTSDAVMTTALKRVGLWSKLETLASKERLPSPLDVEIGEAEGILSAGERQLLCLARCMLTPAPLVVLDEATSSVDCATDRQMQKILREEPFVGKTMLVIAHRLETIMDFDRVVVMDAGRIVEIGRPGELLEREGGVFRGLVEGEGRKRE
ncbi:MAG: hypothetical protein M1820_009646 [Bogoriella megaspora]|nr:MAG: hypothetical protein M1820_009646 [Bogoriella megaspora]